ncbi:MAG: type II toxin-antitoxin system RelE/ParE family toxin [Desulforegulaceae bacterium]|nr:type II toxin-antitoxin system RelE/ParE family toxin [Desulforegulaceae bacterium]
MKIRLLGSAYNDLKYGRRFYEKINSNLGDYFFECLFSEIDSLMLYYGIHPKCFGYFRMLSKRFPYAVYYTIENEEILIWRVLDCRQSPKKTMKFLGMRMD